MDNEILILIIVAIFLVIQAVVGGLIARRRGKSFWLWFAVCLLLVFPIGFIRMLMGTRDDWMP